MVTKHVFVSGRVQGVGFRAYTAQKATALGLMGWVRNLPDGRVEIEVSGPEAEVKSFLEQVRVGPPGAQVGNMDLRDVLMGQPARAFEIRR